MYQNIRERMPTRRHTTLVCFFTFALIGLTTMVFHECS